MQPYHLDLRHDPVVTLQKGAHELGITVPRFSRLLRAAQIPVSKVGRQIWIDRNGMKLARKALAAKVVKRGRKRRPLESLATA